MRRPVVGRLFGTRRTAGDAHAAEEERAAGGERPPGRPPAAREGGGTVTRYLVRYELPPGGRPAGPRPEPVPGQELPPPEVLDRIALFLPDAAAAPGEPGSAGTLGHTRLPNGGTLLCRTRARSADGDEHAPRHVTACYLPAGAADLRGRLPVELWLDPFWEQEQASAWPESGPDGHPGWCDDAHLVEFAAAHADRLEPFLADVQRLFASPAGRQIVIAEHEVADVARWIALAGASLPYAAARSLTFLLRTDAPADAPHHIVGIGPEADFDRGDEVALNHLYRLHDGLGGPGSPPEKGVDGWAQVAAQAWLRGITPRSALAASQQVHGPFAIGPLEQALLPQGRALPGVTAWADAPGNEDAFGEAERALLDHSAPRQWDDDSSLPGAAMANLPSAPPPTIPATPPGPTSSPGGVPAAPPSTGPTVPPGTAPAGVPGPGPSVPPGTIPGARSSVPPGAGPTALPGTGAASPPPTVPAGGYGTGPSVPPATGAAAPPATGAAGPGRYVAPPADAPDGRREDFRDAGAVGRVRPYAAWPARAHEVAPLSSPALANLLAWLGVGVPAGGGRHLVAALAGLAPRGPRELVREQAVNRLCGAIDDLQAEPPSEWGGLLELLLELSPPAATPPGAEGRTPRERFDVKVAARLSRSALDREGHRDNATRALLERLPMPFVGLFLEQTAKSDPGPRPTRLLALAASPLGGWLGRVADAAPLRLRLVVEAQRLGETGARGLPVFRGLATLLPDPAHCEPPLYELAWWLAWRDIAPSAAEAAAVVRDFPAGALQSAGLERELARPLTAPGPVADRLGELACALLTTGVRLTDQQRAIAQVLDAGWRLGEGSTTPTAVVAQLGPLANSGSIRQDLWTWLDTRLAAALAAAGPAELYDPAVVARLGRAMNEVLLLQYAEAQLAPQNRTRLVAALAADPEAAARLFAAWSEDYPWCGSEWTRLAPRLVAEVFGDLAKRLPDDGREQLARHLDAHIDPEWAAPWQELAKRPPDPRGAFGAAPAPPPPYGERPDTGHP